jgi:hypothetical protein
MKVFISCAYHKSVIKNMILFSQVEFILKSYDTKIVNWLLIKIAIAVAYNVTFMTYFISDKCKNVTEKYAMFLCPSSKLWLKNTGTYYW